jgi:hypothetical protein
MEIKPDTKSYNFEEIYLVNKYNFHAMLYKFTNLTQEKDLKYIFFNLEFSNLIKEELDQTYSNFQNAFQTYIEKLNSIYNDTNNEIIFTEFLFCFTAQDNFRFVTFLIPSIKFHKFKEESMMRFQVEEIKFLNLMRYPIEKFSSVSTLSYMNLCEKDKVSHNFSKILLEGKPTRKEHLKSYYYFPKIVISPTRKSKGTLLNLFELSYNYIKDDISNHSNKNGREVMRHTLPIIEETFILEKLVYFKWRHFVAPFEKGCIRFDVKSCVISFKTQITEEDNILMEEFREFIVRLSEFLQNEDMTEIDICDIKIDREILCRLLTYIERLTAYQIYLVLDNNVIKKPFKLFYSEKTELITELNNLLLKDNSIMVEKIFKFKTDDIFDMCGIFPTKLLKYLKFEYHTDLVVYVQNLKEIKEVRFNYDELFANKSNEKRILFSNYKLDVEKTVNISITTLNNQIKKNPDINTFNVLVEPEIYYDLVKITNTHFKAEFETLFKDIVISCPDPTVNKDKTNNHVYTRYYAEFKVTKSYVEGSLANNITLFNSVREKLVSFMVKAKKEFLYNEEFGTTLVFEHLLLTKTQGLLIGMNLSLRLYLILKELFVTNPTYQDYVSFLFKTIKTDFIDLNIFDLEKPVTDTLLRSQYQYITHKMFDYFMKNNKEKISYTNILPIKFNQDYYLIKRDNTLTKLEKQNKNSIVIPQKRWEEKFESMSKLLEQCDYMVI